MVVVAHSAITAFVTTVAASHAMTVKASVTVVAAATRSPATIQAGVALPEHVSRSPTAPWPRPGRKRSSDASLIGGNCSRQFPRTLLRWPPAKSVVFAGCMVRGACGAHAGNFRGHHFVGPPAKSVVFAGCVVRRRLRRSCRQFPRTCMTYNRRLTNQAPAAISPMPNQLTSDSFSPRKATLNTATSTTLSLSIGATRAASPRCSARK